MSNNNLGDETLSAFLKRENSPTRMCFYDEIGEIFRISWNSGKIDVVFSERAKLTESAQRFFDFLKTYIFHGYEIVKRGELENRVS